MKKLIMGIVLVGFMQGFSQNFTSDNVKNYIGKHYHYYWLLGAVEIQLNSDYSYTATYSSEGLFWYNSGKFKFDKGLIKLTPTICSIMESDVSDTECSATLGEARIDLIVDNYSLFYREYLYVESKYNKQLLTTDPENNSFRMPVFGTEVPAGESRMVSTTPVITMGMKPGITTSSVKIRKTPSADGEEVAYYPALFEPEQKSVPNNTTLTIIARTVEKVQMNKWENYWYYINVGANDGVWIFGEFVKFN